MTNKSYVVHVTSHLYWAINLESDARLNIKTVIPRNDNSQDHIIFNRQGDPYTDKTSLYWDGPKVPDHRRIHLSLLSIYPSPFSRGSVSTGLYVVNYYAWFFENYHTLKNLIRSWVDPTGYEKHAFFWGGWWWVGGGGGWGWGGGGGGGGWGGGGGGGLYINTKYFEDTRGGDIWPNKVPSIARAGICNFDIAFSAVWYLLVSVICNYC